jgi:hypothetical protein
MFKRITTFFARLFLFLLFSFLGIAIALNIGKVIVQFADKGALTPWRLLPGSMKFEKIVEATPNEVWAQTTDGSTYLYGDTQCDRHVECKPWLKIEGVPDATHYSDEIQRGNTCNFDKFEYHQELPGKAIECIRVTSAGSEYYATVYYALLADGTIWVWYFEVYSHFMVDDLSIIAVCLFLGFVVGVVIFALCMAWLNRRHQKGKALS